MLDAARLTNHELAFAVPIGVVVAGALTLTGVWLTLRNSRLLAQEERLWNKRAQLYSELITYLRVTAPKAAQARFEYEQIETLKGDIPDVRRQADKFVDQLDLFGSEQTRKTFRTYRNLIDVLFSEAQKQRTAARPTRSIYDPNGMNSAYNNIVTTQLELILLLRADIQSTP